MEKRVSLGIIESYFNKLKIHLDNDVVVAGGGPSGLIAAKILAEKGYKVALFEKKLAPGGGMWGGAMMFNEIIIQRSAIHLLAEIGVSHHNLTDDLCTIDSVEATSALIYQAIKAGATLFNCISIEDVILKTDRVHGVVINWTPVNLQNMHVDPLMISAKVTLDSTGHPSEVVQHLERKNDIKLKTLTGKILGEHSLDVAEGESGTVKNSGCVYPGLYVSGMAANNVHGQSRMGPIFGGMLLSGCKVAELIDKELQGRKNV
ncbi:MAG: sulfide-dependent adenosine diphosphate thiazole synthase [Candidatus Cloacimonetes bacterium]|nr:sulfide-dependent adenosine diphosphate thiazole synthase [Candidatus Cloacimonadota bacterium]